LRLEVAANESSSSAGLWVATDLPAAAKSVAQQATVTLALPPTPGFSRPLAAPRALVVSTRGSSDVDSSVSAASVFFQASTAKRSASGGLSVDWSSSQRALSSSRRICQRAAGSDSTTTPRSTAIASALPTGPKMEYSPANISLPGANTRIGCGSAIVPLVQDHRAAAELRGDDRFDRRKL
jgi:hypothetical protein